MSKSPTKTVVCEAVSTFLTTLPSNDPLLKRKEVGVPHPCLSLIDGSYFLNLALQRFSQPSRATVSYNDLMAQTLGCDSMSSSSSSQSISPSISTSSLLGREPGTWNDLGLYFTTLVAKELRALVERKKGEVGNDDMRDPKVVPTVVIGWDKYSDNIKDSTTEKRAGNITRSLDKKETKCEKEGYVTERGFPIDINALFGGEAILDSFIPYPHEKIMGDGDSKGKIIAFVSHFLFTSFLDGHMHQLVYGQGNGSFHSNVVGLIMDGHRLYSNSHVLIQKQCNQHKLNMISSSLHAMLKTSKRKRVFEEGKAKLSYGVDSRLFFTPISIYLFNVPEDLFNSTSQLPQGLLWNDLSECCAKNEKSDVGGDIEEWGTSKRWFSLLGGDLKESTILQLYRSKYGYGPSLLHDDSPNEIGEFDYTMFRFLHRSVHKLAEANVKNAFTYSSIDSRFEPIGSKIRYAARLVVEDTDAFVMAALATERYIKLYDVELFLQIIGVGKDKRLLAKIPLNDPVREVEVQHNNICYHIHHFCQVYSRMFPNSDYPSSNALFILYSKYNDYIPMGFSGASHATMFSAYASYYDVIGHDLIVDCLPSQVSKWNCLAERDRNFTQWGVLIDPDAFYTFWRALKNEIDVREKKKITNSYSCYVKQHHLKTTRCGSIKVPPLPLGTTFPLEKHSYYGSKKNRRGSIPAGVVCRFLQLNYLLCLYDDAITDQFMTMSLKHEVYSMYYMGES